MCIDLLGISIYNYLPHLLENVLTTAVLALEDGSLFFGKSIGVSGETIGEVVFNTAMTGYQEILTDPSYSKQIVTLTYPHIGNTGTNPEDEESTAVWAAGLVIRHGPTLSDLRETSSREPHQATRECHTAGSSQRRGPLPAIRRRGRGGRSGPLARSA